MRRVVALFAVLVLAGCGGGSGGSGFGLGGFGGSGGASGGGVAPGGGGGTVHASAGGGARASSVGGTTETSLHSGQCFVPKPNGRTFGGPAAPCSDPDATFFVGVKVASGDVCPTLGIRTNLIEPDDSELCLVVNYVPRQCYAVSTADNAVIVHISCSTVRSAGGLAAISTHSGLNTSVCPAPLDPWIDPYRQRVTCVRDYGSSGQ